MQSDSSTYRSINTCDRKYGFSWWPDSHNFLRWAVIVYDFEEWKFGHIPRICVQIEFFTFNIIPGFENFCGVLTGHEWTIVKLEDYCLYKIKRRGVIRQILPDNFLVSTRRRFRQSKFWEMFRQVQTYAGRNVFEKALRRNHPKWYKNGPDTSHTDLVVRGRKRQIINENK